MNASTLNVEDEPNIGTRDIVERVLRPGAANALPRAAATETDL